MKNVFGILLVAAGIMASPAAVGQISQPTSDLRQLVQAMQKVIKPTVGQKTALLIRDGSVHNAQSYPIPLFLNGHVATLDSLDKYSLVDLDELRVDKTEKATALYGTLGSWGVIYVTIKKKKQH